MPPRCLDSVRSSCGKADGETWRDVVLRCFPGSPLSRQPQESLPSSGALCLTERTTHSGTNLQTFLPKQLSRLRREKRSSMGTQHQLTSEKPCQFGFLYQRWSLEFQVQSPPERFQTQNDPERWAGFIQSPQVISTRTLAQSTATWGISGRQPLGWTPIIPPRATTPLKGDWI